MRITIAILVFQLLFQTVVAQLSIPSKKWGIGYGYHKDKFTGILFHSIANREKESRTNGLNISFLIGRADMRGFSYATVKNSFRGSGIGVTGVVLNGYYCGGIFITGVVTDIHHLTGISISPVNKIESHKGVVIGLVNINHRKQKVARRYFSFPYANKGVQIGLLNHQKIFRGVQIGLININKSNKGLFRVMPFININFRKFTNGLK